MSLEDRIVALATAIGADVKALLAGGASIAVFAYDERGELRTATGLLAVVEGLGLFQHEVGSDEPDDDESCFATASGRWLMQAAHWDVVAAWLAPDDAARDERDEDEPSRVAAAASTAVAAALSAKLLTGSAICAIASIAAVASASFSGSIPGAAIGDFVIAMPPAAVGADGRLSFYAFVSAAGTVTVTLANASSSSASVAAAVRTAWPILVIKQ